MFIKEPKDYAGLPAEEDRWVKQRNAVLRGDQGKGWDAVKKGRAQYYSGKALDASLLLMPQASLSAPTTPLAHHPRTCTRGARSRHAGLSLHGLQAADDGFSSDEGTVSMCSEALHTERIEESMNTCFEGSESRRDSRCDQGSLLSRAE